MVDNYSELTDLDLLRKIALDDDQTAMSELYKRYWELLFVSAWNLLMDRDACEDIIHDVFYSFWSRRSEMVDIESPKGYLFQSVKFQVFKHIRHQKVRREVFDDIQNRVRKPDMMGMNEKQASDMLEGALQILPSQCQEAFRLSRLDSLSYNEIADKMNISHKTVERHIGLALKKLRRYFGQELLLLLIILLYIL